MTSSRRRRWLGSTRAGSERALLAALRASVLDAAAAAAADEAAVGDARALALAQITVTLRSEEQLGNHPPPPNIVINAGAGRLARPLLLADASVGGAALLSALRGGESAAVTAWLARTPTLRRALADRAAAFLDASAAATAVLGCAKDTWWHSREPYTHVEPHPAFKLSTNLVGLTCMEHNPVPRLTLSATHRKQGTQINYNEAGTPFRGENMLASGTAPALRGAADELLRTQELATGELAICLISAAPGAAAGNNREDCILMWRGAAARGLLMTVSVAAATQERCVGLVEERDEDARSARSVEPHRTFREGAPYEADGVPPLDTPVPTYLDPHGFALCAHPAAPEKSKNTDSRGASIASSILFAQSLRGKACFRVRTATVQPRPAGPGSKLSNAHGCKGVVEYGEVPRVVGGGGAPAFVPHPMSLGARGVFGYVLEAVIGYAMACPLVHLREAARERCYELRAALAAGSPWEAERVALVTEFAEASGLRGLLATARGVHPTTGSRSAQRVAYGLVYTSLLKHFPSAKLQARGTGADEAYMACKGPHPGRLTGGAQKLGRMEQEQVGAIGCAFAHNGLNSVSSDTVPRLVCGNRACGTLLGGWGPCPVCAARIAGGRADWQPGVARVTLLSAETERLMHLLRVMGLDLKLEVAPYQGQ